MAPDGNGASDEAEAVRVTQVTFSGSRIPDEAIGLLRTVHQGLGDGSLRPRLDLGRWFRQSRLQGVA